MISNRKFVWFNIYIYIKLNWDLVILIVKKLICDLIVGI